MVTRALRRPTSTWTPERQAEAVLAVLRGDTSPELLAGAHDDVDAEDVRGWVARFLEAGARALEPARPEPRRAEPGRARAPARTSVMEPGDKRVCRDVTEAVGRTPLVRLNASVDHYAEVWAKLELMNPMGSIKDRVGRHLVERAAADGRLAPGGTLVEASSGNTAMGLGMMAAVRGYRCKVAVRDRTSAEKVRALRAIGVEVEVVPSDLPPEHPESYNRCMARIVRETPGCYFPDQHNNRENNEAHYLTTGPELWEQMDGRIDVLVCGMGTGGTIGGVARYLKEQDPGVRVVAVDPVGSVFHAWFHERRLGRPGSYRVEGLGDEALIDCVEWDLIDDVVQVSDREAFHAARDLARRDALFVGGSSGAALVGVRREIARLAGRPARIATVFPDGGRGYLSKLYDDAWLEAQGLH